MNFLEILSCGIWLALPITGLGFLSYTKCLSALASLPVIARISIVFTVGIALWSFLILGSAIVGLYHAPVLGSAAWLLFFYGIYISTKNESLKTLFHENGFCKWDIIFIVGLLVATFLYFGFPTESILGGRDQGVYANHAIYINNHGRLDVPYPWDSPRISVDADEEQLLRNIFANFSLFYFPGFFRTEPTMIVQFSHLFPVWLAQAFASFDYYGLFGLNSFFSLLSIMSFYGLLCMFLDKKYSALGAIILALNVSQIWISRITLTEVLAQLFIISSIVVYLQSLKSKNTLAAVISGILLGFSALTRLDSIVFIPLLSFSAFLNLFFETNTTIKRISFCFYTSSIISLAIFFLYYPFLSYPYFIYLWPQLSKIIPLSVLMIFTLGYFSRRKVKLLTLKKRLYQLRFNWNYLIAITGFILIVLLLFAYFIRPHLTPYSVYDWPDNHLHGTRDYREDSLVRLSKYLPLPLIFISIIGWIKIMREVILPSEGKSELIPLLTISLGYTLLYLWNPSVSPDHFWAIRRFVPVIIPFLIFFSCVGLSYLLRKIENENHKISDYIFISIIMFLVVFYINSNKLIYNFAEDKGIYIKSKEIAQMLPNDEIIFSNLSNESLIWGTTFYSSFDRKIVLIDFNQSQIVDSFLEYANNRTRSGKSVYFLGTDDTIFPDGASEKINEVTVERKIVEPTLNPLPERILTTSYNFGVYKFTKPWEGYDNTVLGFSRAFGVPETGFYDSEWHSEKGIPVRWTNGNAKLEIPLIDGYWPKFLTLYLESTGPEGVNLSILANGTEVLNKSFPPLDSLVEEITLPENLKNNSGKLMIELLSGTFKPSNFNKQSLDNRDLGLFIKGIRLSDYDVLQESYSELPNEAYQSSIKMISPSTKELVFKDEDQKDIRVLLSNEGSTSWLSEYDVGQAIGSVRLGAIWFSQKDVDVRLGEQRWNLPYLILPGETAVFRPSLKAVSYDGNPLEPGEYEVWLGLVEEGRTWFYEKGDNVLKLNVKVER